MNDHVTLADLIPNMQDASADEVFAAATEVKGTYLVQLEGGNIAIDAAVPNSAVWVIPAYLMEKVLDAVNTLRHRRITEAEVLRLELGGEIVSPADTIAVLEHNLSLMLTLNGKYQQALERGAPLMEQATETIDRLTAENKELRRGAKPRRRFGW